MACEIGIYANGDLNFQSLRHKPIRMAIIEKSRKERKPVVSGGKAAEELDPSEAGT